MATPTSLPASFSTGQVLTATNMNDIRGAFRVLQVVTATYDTLQSNSTTTYADTGLSASITPSATSNKVLIVVSQSFSKSSGNASNAVKSRLVRGTTPTELIVWQGAALYTGTTVDLVGSSSSVIYLDSPSTTSSTTYKTQFANFTAAASVSANPNSGMATMLLMEISA